MGTERKFTGKNCRDKGKGIRITVIAAWSYNYYIKYLQQLLIVICFHFCHNGYADINVT